MAARLYQRRFGIDERSLLEFPVLRRAPIEAPRVLFTHAGDAMRRPNEIRIDASDYAGKRVALIARHPGDIAVSRYHHLRHRSRDRARQRLAEQPLETFVWANDGGVPSIVAFLNSVVELPGVTIVRYEDFLAEPNRSLRLLANAIGLAVTDDDIAAAVEFGSLPNLRQREQEGYFTSARLRRARDSDAQSGKVRSGTSGGYRKQLRPEDAARIDSYLRDHLDPRFGYSAA